MKALVQRMRLETVDWGNLGYVPVDAEVMQSREGESDQEFVNRAKSREYSEGFYLAYPAQTKTTVTILG